VSGPAAGTLLSGALLSEALTTGRIFWPETCDLMQVRGASYELRLAGDLLVIPTSKGAGTFRTVLPKDPSVGEFILAPGDSALVSTCERFCMDFCVSGLLGPKFRWSAKGLLVLQGMVAHPGYGRERSPSGEWLPKTDERLYLIVANVGPADIVMRRNDPIASIQFYEVEPAAHPEAVPNFGFDDLSSRLFATGETRAEGGLAYFKNVRDLQREVQDERLERESRFKALEASVSQQLDAVKGQVAGAQLSVDRVRNATDNVVVFGAFLIAATLLGAVLSTLTGVVERLPDHVTIWRTIAVGGLCVTYAIAVVVGVVMVIRALGKSEGLAKQPVASTDQDKS
jgi:deoxycytidine triphosphate deaminase